MIDQLSSHLFWEYDTKELELKKDMALIILRVLEFGCLHDWELLKDYYSIEDIKSAALSARSMDEVALNFVALYTKTPITKFRCYKYSLLTQIS